ncbi:MAG: arabinogalactan endo-beta-1,4-galactanase [Flavobacterium sp.]
MRNTLFFLVLFGSILFGQSNFYLGADLSYVNEVEDAGAVYRYQKKKIDPYQLFAQKKCNLVRLRLWHQPSHSPYSNLADVSKSIQRAKKQSMQVLLDFHYSDTWADPEKQYIPKAWSEISELKILGDSVYQYTYKTLEHLFRLKQLPEIVQIGNETNSEILQPEGKHAEKINWERNTFLLNQGLLAVKDFNEKHQTNIQRMLHIAQPENALWWFEEAHQNGIENYEWIGLSYYPLWSKYTMEQLPEALSILKEKHQKEIMIVETAYPFTLTNIDKANNILNEKALLPEFPCSPEGQKKYMISLVNQAIKGGAKGVIYWEAAWVTSNAHTLWGHGSHWDNATFFDSSNQNEALPVFDFFNPKNYLFQNN